MISICLPYWNRQPQLDRMFADYARHYQHLNLEFSVCDDGSPTPARVPAGVVLTRLPEKTEPRNPCVPINRAVAASHGEIIVLTSAEIEHLTDVLTGMLVLLEDPLDYVTAACVDTNGLWLAGPTVRYDEHGRAPVPPGAHFHFCAMFSRKLWEYAGGFDEEYRMGQAYDDNDWLWRAYVAGARFKQAPGVVGHTRSHVQWRLPLNDKLFERKWPAARRAALVAARG